LHTNELKPQTINSYNLYTKKHSFATKASSDVICKEGCRFSMGWCMGEPYCPLSSAICNATIPTLVHLIPSFEMAESAFSPFCNVLHYLLFLITTHFTDMCIPLSPPQSLLEYLQITYMKFLE
jgi:hypothetical protein